jgi:uncharacterized heparinase superfamily protein
MAAGQTRFVRAYVRGFAQKSQLYGFTLMGKGHRYLTTLAPDPWPGDVLIGQNLLNGGLIIQGRFTPLNEIIYCLENAREFPIETVCRIHSFEWLRDLKSVGHNISRKLARQLIIEWILRNHSMTQRSWTSPAWHMDILGYRIANWIALYDFFGTSGDEYFKNLFFTSLYRQIKELNRAYGDSPHADVRLKAIKGLIFSSAYKKLEEHTYTQALDDLKECLRELFYSDGGHKSGCPAEQYLTLRDIIDIRTLCRTLYNHEPDFIAPFIQLTTPILRLLRTGDGGLSTFKGNLTPHNSGFFPEVISSNLVDMVLSLSDARGRPPAKAPLTGFERMMNKSGLVVMNTQVRTNPSGPDGLEPGLPVMNFEWSCGRNRMISAGDVIVQFDNQQWLTLPPAKGTLITKRSTQSADIIWEGDFDQRVDETIYRHERQLFLGSDGGDLRGHETLTLNQKAMVAFRFVLTSDITVDSPLASNQLVLRVASKAGGVESQWRFFFSGCEDMIIIPAEQHTPTTLLLMANVEAAHPWKVKWAFRQMDSY